MTTLRVQRSPLGALYRSPFGVRGRQKEEEEGETHLPWNIWVASLGGKLDFAPSVRLQQRMFFDRLGRSIVPELRAILDVPVNMVQEGASGTVFNENPSDGPVVPAFNGTAWIRDVIPAPGINVVLLYGGRPPSRSAYFKNYNCGIETPVFPDLSTVTIDSLANNPPTNAEAKAWFSQYFSSSYVRPTNPNSILDFGVNTNLSKHIKLRQEVFDGTRNSNKIIFLTNPGGAGFPSSSRGYVFLIRAFLNSNARISTYRINPGVVSSADIFAGSWGSIGCPDGTLDMSGSTMSLFQQIVAMNPATDPRFKWTIGGSWDYESLDAATLIGLVQPHL